MLVRRCSESLALVREIRGSVCQNFQREASGLRNKTSRPSTTTTQVASQQDNQELNQENEGASDSMVGLFGVEEERLRDQQKKNREAISQKLCAGHSEYAGYQKKVEKLNGDLEAYGYVLEKMKEVKDSDSEEARTVAMKSASIEEKSGSLRAEGESGISPALLGVGAAAGVGTLALLGAKGGGEMDLANAREDEDREAHSVVSAPPTPEDLREYEGDADKLLNEYGIRALNFTDSQKKQIAWAVSAVPECHRPLLNGLTIAHDPNLKWRSKKFRGKCLPGRKESAKLIKINTNCYNGVDTSLILHEMIHVIAGRRGMYAKYAETYHKMNRCPVSLYNAEMNNTLGENFTDAARFVLMPNSGGRHSADCVKTMVEKAREVILACK
jgi:hypothetical protein